MLEYGFEYVEGINEYGQEVFILYSFNEFVDFS